MELKEFMIHKGVKMPELVRLPLLDLSALNDFQRFLAMERILPFFKMLILTALGTGQYKLFFYKVEYGVEDQNENWTSHAYEPVYVNAVYDEQEVFCYLLQKLGFEQIIREHDLKIGQLESSEGPLPLCPPGWSTIWGGDVILETDNCIVIDTVDVYCPLEMVPRVKAVIDEHKKVFLEFLDEQRHALSIDHDIYFEWLQTWFPGKIKIRSIE